MHLERSDFFGASSGSWGSHYIYVFGGTPNSKDKSMIERYDSRDDEWEVMSVKIEM
jgi:hypothetical protein